MIVLFFAANLLLSADTDVIKPKWKQVVLIFRCDVVSPINSDFFAETFDIPARERQNDTSVTVNSLTELELVDKKADAEGVLGDFFYVAVDAPKDRVIKLDYFKCLLFGKDELIFTLPVFGNLVIPEGKDVQYVYAGTFLYKIEQPFFTVTDLFVTDEYEDAAATLSAALRKDVMLYRGILQPIEDEDENEE